MSARVCSVDGCENAQVARTWCWKHYQRVRRTGSLYHPEDPRHPGETLPTLVHRPADEERFHAKIRRVSDEAGEHWLWTGAVRQGDGAPVFRHGTTVSSARRYCWQLYTGKVLTRIRAVRTTCGEVLCVNPDHLESVLLHQIHAERAAARKDAP